MKSDWVKLSDNQNIWLMLDMKYNLAVVYPENTSWYYSVLGVGQPPEQFGPFESEKVAKVTAEVRMDEFSVSSDWIYSADFDYYELIRKDNQGKLIVCNVEYIKDAWYIDIYLDGNKNFCDLGPYSTKETAMKVAEYEVAKYVGKL
jgi:hypothetical protein